MYMIPEDDFDTGIKHAMLHVDLGDIYHISKERQHFNIPYEDPHKVIRKSTGSHVKFNEHFLHDLSLNICCFFFLSVARCFEHNGNRLRYMRSIIKQHFDNYHVRL